MVPETAIETGEGVQVEARQLQVGDKVCVNEKWETVCRIDKRPKGRLAVMYWWGGVIVKPDVIFLRKNVLACGV